MTIEEIEKLVEKVKETSFFEDEGAHELEDELHQNVLKAIAGGASNPAELARAALKTCEIEFHRWYS